MQEPDAKHAHGSMVQVDLDAELERVESVRDPRERLVRSGVVALIRFGRTVVEGGLSPELITKVAGRSRRSYYDHFNGKSDFTDQLVDDVLGIGGPTPARLEVADNLLDSNSGDLAESLRLMSAAPTLSNSERINRIARQIVTALGTEDPYARERIAGFYARDRMVYEPVIGALVDSWGLKFREPWDIETATVFFRTIVDGIAMRAAVDETVDETDMVFIILKTLLPGITHVADSSDHRSVDDIVRDLSDQARNHVRERRDPSVVMDARKLVHEAVQFELARRGFEQTSLDIVARTAGISSVTIRRGLGGVNEICADLFVGLVADLDSTVEHDLEADDADLREVLHNHVARTTRMIVENRPLAHAMWVMVSQPNDVAIGVFAGLVGITERILRRAEDEGLLPEGFDDAQQHLVAETLSTQLLRIGSVQNASAQDAAALLDLLVRWK